MSGRRFFATVLLALLGTAGAATRPVPEAPAPEAIVLGIAQDGGVPHLGCRQPLCVAARKDPAMAQRVASLGLVDPGSGKRFVIDATPDFARQVEIVGGLPDAILLTHAHIGHYLGLAQLGREVLDAKRFPVYCTPAMAEFLRKNKPWSRLLERGNVVVNAIEPGREIALTPNLRVTAIRVPHRDEDSDTVAYLVAGPRGKILWLPDIDRFEKWDRRVEDFARDPDLTAFLDGTFYAADEIPGRSIAEIPHPLVPDTAARLAAGGRPAARVLFVHLNHTNRLLWDADAVKDLEARGFGVAREGARYPL